MVRFGGEEAVPDAYLYRASKSLPDERSGSKRSSSQSRASRKSGQPTLSLSPDRSGALNSTTGSLRSPAQEALSSPSSPKSPKRLTSGSLRSPSNDAMSSPSSAMRSTLGPLRSPRSSARLSQSDETVPVKHEFLRRKRAYDPPRAETQDSEAVMKERLKSYSQVAVASHKLGAFASAQPEVFRDRSTLKSSKQLSPLGLAGQEALSPRPNQQRIGNPVSGHMPVSTDQAEDSSISPTPTSPRPDQRASVTWKSEEAPEPTGMLMDIARRLGMNLHDVRIKWREFMRLDTDSNGYLTRDEFEDSVRVQCSLARGQPLPEQLSKLCFTAADKNRNGRVDFEEFVLWTSRHEFTEEWLVADESERKLRKFVRLHGLCIADVDQVRVVFRKLDTDDSGTLDAEEFKTALCTMLGAKRREDIPALTLQRYWKEVDVDQDGEVTFEEFAMWYFGLREKY